MLSEIWFFKSFYKKCKISFCFYLTVSFFIRNFVILDNFINDETYACQKSQHTNRAYRDVSSIVCESELNKGWYQHINWKYPQKIIQNSIFYSCIVNAYEYVP